MFIDLETEFSGKNSVFQPFKFFLSKNWTTDLSDHLTQSVWLTIQKMWEPWLEQVINGY